jgi:hypothetical protein
VSLHEHEAGIIVESKEFIYVWSTFNEEVQRQEQDPEDNEGGDEQKLFIHANFPQSRLLKHKTRRRRQEGRRR